MKSYLPLFIILVISLVACSNGGGNNNNQVKADSVIVIPVEAEIVQLGDVSAYYTSTATLEAEEEAKVVAKTNGIITKILVEEGTYVKSGTPLLTLDDTQYILEVERAEANLNRLASDYNRNKEMYERNMVSAEVFERIKYEYESQQATLRLARLNAEYTTVKAPIDGVVSQRFVRTGNMVVQNQELFTITDMDPLLAILHLPEHELSKIKPGQKVLFTVDAVQNTSFEGFVERISPVVDRTTGTFRVVVYVRDAQQRLKPGMFARVKVVYDTRQSTLVMPKLALINEGGINSVFVIQDSVVQKRQISVGYANGSLIEILSGLDLGTKVVTVGQNSLRDSTRVDVINLL